MRNQLVQMVILSGIPFRIHQKTEPVLKGHVLELRIGKLVTGLVVQVHGGVDLCQIICVILVDWYGVSPAARHWSQYEAVRISQNIRG